MINAYRIGISVVLNNAVSGALGMMSRDFMKAERDAGALKKTLRDIKILGAAGAVAGGLGLAGFKALGAIVKPANEYVHQLELLKANNLSAIDLAHAQSAAWKATGSVMTTTATDNLAAIRELRMVFGDTNTAIEHMPTVQKMQAVLGTVKEGKFGEGEAYTIAKALEMKGAVQNVAQFDTAANAMVKAMIAAGGKVTGADFLSTFKYGRLATQGWNDNFTYTILPTLIQEMKSAGGTGGAGGPGNALMSAYAEVVGGKIPQKALAVWDQMGLLDKSKIVSDKVGSTKGLAPGGILGSDEFTRDPYTWAQEHLLPALVKHGYTTIEKQMQAIQYLFPNRTAGFIMNQLTTQGWKFKRDQGLIQQASGLEAYNTLIKTDPKLAERAAESNWTNLKVAFGIQVVPYIVRGLTALSGALNTMAQFFHDHETLAKGLVFAFAGLSGALAFSGIVWGLTSAFSALKLVMTLGGLIGGGGAAAAAGGGALAVEGGAAAAGGAAGIAALLGSPLVIAAAAASAVAVGVYLGYKIQDTVKNTSWEDVKAWWNRNAYPDSSRLHGGDDRGAQVNPGFHGDYYRPKSWNSQNDAMSPLETAKMFDKMQQSIDALKNVSINMDGQKVGSMVFGGFSRSSNSPLTGSSNVDPGQSRLYP